MLKGGNKERTQEPTAANKTSSRSHAVLIVSIKQRQRVTGIHQQLRVGKLFLIDLAGSERAANTQNRGKRMVEGAHINRSLLALGNCINALSKYTSLVFGPGRRVPKSHSSCCCCCCYQFSKKPQGFLNMERNATKL